MKTDKVPVTCPVCGHVQLEPPTGYSTVCRQCHQYYRVQEVLRPSAQAAPPPRETREVACFGCRAVLRVVLSAQSTICKRCGCHVDLTDYCISKPIGKNYRTKGRFLIEKDGLLYNTETLAGEVIIKGRLLGKITAERSLELHSTAEIRGSFQTPRLIVPAGQVFRWPEPIALESAEIAGELVADLRVTGTLLLKSTARFFGHVRAQDLIVESGAVFVGGAAIGRDLPRDSTEVNLRP